MQLLLFKVTPAVHCPKDRTAYQRGTVDPLYIGLNRAKPLQGRGLIGAAQIFSIAFAPRQIQADSRVGDGLDVLYLQAA
ncbi:hypothetical protein CCL20_25335 [Pseudomonas syringae]|nr:hypothetical protein CCL20_25335 [Pseudomonas syringae]